MTLQNALGNLALDATLTGGTAKTRITDGTHTAVVDVNGGLNVNVLSGGGGGGGGGASAGVAANAAAVSGNPVLVSGYDGTLVRTLLTDTAGRQVVNINSGPTTQAVTGTFWQTTQPVSGTVTANVGTTNGLALDATLTGGTQKSKLVDSGGTNVASVSAGGALKVDGTGGTFPVSGTVATTGTYWQTTQPVSMAAVPTGAALDTTLTGGTAKAIARGAAKGTTTAADITSTPSGSNHQPLDVAIYDGFGNQIQSFGGGTQYATGAAQATPTGTTALGWDGTSVKALPLDGSGFLKVNVAAGGAGGGAVSGIAAAGVAVSGNPVLTAGTDGTNVRTLLTDASGHLVVNVNSAPSTAVTGTFWQTTQPVSMASAPTGAALDATLTGGTQKTKIVDSGGTNVATVTVGGAVVVDASASGAATAAKQPALGTVLSPSTDVLTVQPPSNTAFSTHDVANDDVTFLLSLILKALGASDNGKLLVSVGAALPTGANTIGTVNAVESGTWTVQPGNTPNTTPWLQTVVTGGYPLGLDQHYQSQAAFDTARTKVTVS